jgi:hypothetical protein
MALLITICFVGYLLGTEYIFGSPPTPCPVAQHCLGQQSPGLVVLDLAAIIGGLTLGVFVVLALGTSLSLAVLRSEFGLGMLRFALGAHWHPCSDDGHCNSGDRHLDDPFMD